MSRYLGLIAGALLWTAPGLAQTYPVRPVTLVLPFGSGSSTDIFARVVGQGLQEELRQAIVIENKPGGNASIAAEYVARAKPDGYTLLLSGQSGIASNVHLIKNLRYDPVKDFEPVSYIGKISLFVAVDAASPYKTVDDLIADARKQPHRLSFGTASAPGLVASGALTKFAGIDMIQVPYKSSPQALIDLMGGRLRATMSDFPAASGHLSSGKVRALAVAGARRSELAPNVPTFEEVGMKGFDLVGWFGVFAPAGTPKEVVGLLSDKLKIVLAKPAVKTTLNQVGFEVLGTSPEELGTLVRSEIDAWGRYVKEFDLKIE